MKVIARIGDICRLNSGSQDMTVNFKIGKQLTCMWFTSDGVLQQEVINSDALTLIRN